MADRLFDLDEIPEVPLFREPPPGRGAQIMDERISHDYPPEWAICPDCRGRGWFVASDGVERRGECLSDGHRRRDPSDDPPGWERRKCDRCLGMGSVKAMVRLLAGHRCVRCLHPYVPKGDAKMLGVEPTPYRWSPCDPRCVHLGPIRWRESADPAAEWREQILDEVGQLAGEGILDHGPSGEPVWRYDVEAEWRILTVHHLDGDKANLAWWNLAALCQRCHLEIQGRVVMERVYPHEHSEWFHPYVAGYYASVYLGESLTRDEVEARLPELLALEAIT